MGKGYKNCTTKGISEEFQKCSDISKPESNLFTRFIQFLNALKKNPVALRPQWTSLIPNYDINLTVHYYFVVFWIIF